MGSMDRVDDLTFKANFSSDGVAKLRDRVKDKLKEFMGDYTDDTLVEYVIVLLRNGRRKEEARNELNVFLGDDSDSFVSWLWDHLASHLELYMQSPKLQDETSKRKLISWDEVDGNDLDSESEKMKSGKSTRSRHNKEWKNLVREGVEPPTLRSSVVDDVQSEEKLRQKSHQGRRSLSPTSPVQRKRSRRDEESAKRDVVTQATINAPRRLLQFAVRDAVATSKPSKLSTSGEPSFKRLRSVVSTSAADSTSVDCTHRVQSVARVPNRMATVIKAVTEAAEDAVKAKYSGNVFDRLGGTVDLSDTSEQLENNMKCQEHAESLYLRRNNYSGQFRSNRTMMENDIGFPSCSTSENGRFGDVNVMGPRVTGSSQVGTSLNNDEDSMMVQYGVAKNPSEIMHRRQNMDQAQPPLKPNSSHEIVNISVNVNTWKPSNYPERREVTNLGSQKLAAGSDLGAPRSGARLKVENGNPVKISNGNAKPPADIQKETARTQSSTPGSYPAGHSLEDADSRTIFVSNVHFAATKDRLSRHFNKFGEVLKVILVIDAATGQPKGAAYVEFMRKDASENALSLDGTSFMSRILKVSRKSAADQEPAPLTTWPRIIRGSPFAPARFSRAPFPRGMAGAFRPRPPIKAGARSLQWKRDAQGTPEASAPSSTTPASAGRGLTYIRPESKSDGNLGTG